MSRPAVKFHVSPAAAAYIVAVSSPISNNVVTSPATERKERHSINYDISHYPASSDELAEWLMECSNETAQHTIEALGSSAHGLSAAQSADRAREFGPNTMLSFEKPTWYRLLWQALVHPFNFLLLALSIGAAAISDFGTLTVLLVMVAMAVLLRWWQELKSVFEAESLRRQIRQYVRVRRPKNAAHDTSPPTPVTLSLSAATAVEMKTLSQTLVKSSSPHAAMSPSTDSAEIKQPVFCWPVQSDVVVQTPTELQMTAQSPAPSAEPTQTQLVEAAAVVQEQKEDKQRQQQQQPTQPRPRALTSSGINIDRLTTPQPSPADRTLTALAMQTHAFVQAQAQTQAQARPRAQTNAQTAAQDSGNGNSSIAGSEDYEIARVLFENVVPGGVIELSSGCLVPGDVRILESQHLHVNQSLLTGESLPVAKTGEAHTGPADSDFLHRSNLAFMGATVDSGFAVAIVLATGKRTYFGQNANQLVLERPKSAFELGIQRVSYVFLGCLAVLAPLVAVVSGIVQGNWAAAARFGVSVGVGLTPELLPAVVNTNLTLGASVMSKNKAIVKRLAAVQNLGAVNILCTDKTGTLTEDRVSVHASLSAVGVVSDLPLWVAYLIAQFQTAFINVLDSAILRHAEDLGLATPSVFKVGEIPFDFGRRRMSVALNCSAPGGQEALLLLVKGAVAETLGACTHEICDESQPAFGSSSPFSSPSALPGFATRPLTAERFASIVALCSTLASQGLRVVAVAMRKLLPGESPEHLTTQSEAGLALVGFICFLDPPKKDAATTLQQIRALNCQLKVLTGDHLLVAKKVCGDIGVDTTHTLTGEQLRTMTWDDEDAELRALFLRTTIFAGMNPGQKARVVAVLRDCGNTVGYMGDGVNDALALREADVGISVDTGSDLAKESADIILTEKNLDVVRQGIITGRRVHGNTIKYVKMAASSNFGNVFSMLIASAWLPFLPMLPQHILLQNLLYDISQVAIPWDNMDADYLAYPREWSARTLASFMAVMGVTSSLFDIVTFLFLWYYFGFDDPNNPTAVTTFQTCWFLEGLLTQAIIVHMIRTSRLPFVHSVAAWQVSAMTLLICSLGFIIVNTPPLELLFSMHAPQPLYYPFLLATITGYMVLSQLAKRLYIRAFGVWL